MLPEEGALGLKEAPGFCPWVRNRPRPWGAKWLERGAGVVGVDQPAWPVEGQGCGSGMFHETCWCLDVGAAAFGQGRESETPDSCGVGEEAPVRAQEGPLLRDWGPPGWGWAGVGREGLEFSSRSSEGTAVEAGSRAQGQSYGPSKEESRKE